MPPWAAGPELQRFVNRLVQGLPLRQPSAIDSSRLCRLLAERAGGITLHIRRALERAAIAAVRSGEERITAAALEATAVWGSAQVMLPALDVAPPSIFWGKQEIAIDAFHHAVYALTTGIAYRLLSPRAPRRFNCRIN